jgi:hypothetical protein
LDDLDSLRDEVMRYLEQAGLNVLPKTWYPRGPTAFREAVDRDIAQSVLFAQLLSKAAGKKSPDLPKGYAGLQYDCNVATLSAFPTNVARHWFLSLFPRGFVIQDSVGSGDIKQWRDPIAENARKIGQTR